MTFSMNGEETATVSDLSPSQAQDFISLPLSSQVEQVTIGVSVTKDEAILLMERQGLIRDLLNLMAPPHPPEVANGDKPWEFN
jgi:hypothetical protein